MCKGDITLGCMQPKLFLILNVPKYKKRVSENLVPAGKVARLMFKKEIPYHYSICFLEYTHLNLSLMQF